MNSLEQIAFHESIRNKLFLVSLFVVTSILACYGTVTWAWSVQMVPLGKYITLPIPLFGLAPLVLFTILLHRRYDRKLILTKEYLLFVEGVVSFKEHSLRVQYRNIREIGIDQTIVQRILGVGDLLVSPLATQLESAIRMPGISNPRAAKDEIYKRVQLDQQAADRSGTSLRANGSL